ncbi:Sec-independent protein translocase protein TatA [Methylopila jiangsuensis]|uniref:Sec-independent protein translocase protein TatA n=1 Tax=Methylopila jiangsuensis TaxID=586230 RepID=A0A9W6JE04_9HYPH|nr:twin-arginine translocase TatA/TatE family subunit [Methylopila jiangsuensis]MDR6286097.1 sec-independent protein translocase protein TatA [Methylopila jiangsuensis]GLK75855.1 Sec-independent protein translocase protein TatA [Methylopila jiangsuensis]
MSLTHWLVVAVLVLLLFGRGKISELMGDMAKGIKSFKKGLAEDDDVAEGMSQNRGGQTIEHRQDAQARTGVGANDVHKS